MLHTILRRAAALLASSLFFGLSLQAQQKTPAGYQGKRFLVTVDYNMSAFLNETTPLSQREKLRNSKGVRVETTYLERSQYFFLGNFSLSLDYMLNRRLSVFGEWETGQFYFDTTSSTRASSINAYEERLKALNVPILDVPANQLGSNHVYIWGDVFRYQAFNIGLRFFSELGPVSWSYDISYMPVLLSTQSKLVYSTSTAHFIRTGLKSTFILHKHLTASIGAHAALHTALLDRDPQNGYNYTDQPIFERKVNLDGFKNVAMRGRLGLHFKVGIGYLF